MELADLNNDGKPDLIVANSGSNNVLVYPALGNGQFGPALNDGHGFFTGTNPVGITVADLTGDGRPDLIITDKGSNDVSILINVQVGNSFTFVQGPRLQAGIGPVATAVVNLPGSPFPDLLITDSGSNDVRLLQGLGNGFFNDQNPTIYPVGTDPTSLVVGQFTNGPGQDLATINSGSNSVSVISGLGAGTPVTQSFPTGGVDPVAALAVGLQGNGLDSLVVANNGDGNISLLTPGENGLAVSSVLSTPGLPNPSSLALASFGGGGVDFYASTEGVESATLLGFQLEESTGGVPGGEGGTTGSSGSSGSGATVQLVSLNESSLALVGTLLTITLNTEYEGEQTSEGVAAAVATGSGPSAGQSLKGPIASPDEESDEMDVSLLPAQPQQPIPTSWARFVTGVDQALEELRRDADQRLRDEQQPPKTQEQPGTTRFDANDRTRPSDATSSLVQPSSDVRRRSDAGPNRSNVIDAAIRSLRPKERFEMRSHDSFLAGKTDAEPPAPLLDAGELMDGADPLRRADRNHPERDGIPVLRMATLIAFSTTAVSPLLRGTLSSRRFSRNAGTTRVRNARKPLS
jgi:hypothetical protein